MQMGHDEGGNPNIHACRAPVAPSLRIGEQVFLCRYRVLPKVKADRSLDAAYDMTDLHYYRRVFNNLLRKDILVPEQCGNCTTIIVIIGATFLGIGIPSNMLIT